MYICSFQKAELGGCGLWGSGIAQDVACVHDLVAGDGCHHLQDDGGKQGHRSIVLQYRAEGPFVHWHSVGHFPHTIHG